jgi:glycosyltransferase involved in cell wall biosynthesis
MALKIVQIEDFFHPDAGYKINILSKYFAKMGHETVIITAELDKIPDFLVNFFGRDNIEERDREYERRYGVKIIRRPIRAYVSGRAIFSEDLIKLVNSLKPDILYVHGNDTATGMRILRHLKELDCPLIMDNHMVEMASQNPLRKLYRIYYRNFIAPIIIKNQIPVVRAMDDDYVERCLGVPLTLAPWISYGSDMLLFHPDKEAGAKFREANGISKDAFVVLFAGKFDESKGGMLLAELTCREIKTDKEIVYLMIGNATGDYGAEVEKRFADSKYRVLRLPTQKYCDLAGFYQAADLGLIAKQASLNFFDMEACGVPVLSEDNNLNQLRSGNENAWLFTPDSVDDFAAKLEQIVNMDSAELAKYSENAYNFVKENYDYHKKALEYIDIIQSVYERGKK